jgi:hypothetical protein
MGHDTTSPWTAHLSPREAAAAGRAVFTWSLVPAAGRLARATAAGHDARDAVADLRDAVRLLDCLGWPDEAHAPIDLTPEDSGTVRAAAQMQLGHGLDPDPVARARVARGRADAPSARGGPLRILLGQLADPPPGAGGAGD